MWKGPSVGTVGGRDQAGSSAINSKLPRLLVGHSQLWSWEGFSEMEPEVLLGFACESR